MNVHNPLAGGPALFMAWLSGALTLLASPAAVSAALTADAPHSCDACVAWNQPRAPFRVYGATWFVGTKGLSAILITSAQGHVLIDGALPQSALLIAANIETAGFRLEDVKLILNSHTHFDHAGGIAALQRASGAQVAASPASRLALEKGRPTADDPQYGFGRESNSFPVVRNVRAVADGETLHVGTLAITAHFTPGHTSGSTTWTWRSCESDRCLDIVYADSLNPVAAPAFRFNGDPDRLTTFTHSIALVAGLPCDLLLAPHPDFLDLDAKLATWRETPGVNPFIDSTACRSYAAAAQQKLDLRIVEEHRGK